MCCYQAWDACKTGILERYCTWLIWNRAFVCQGNFVRIYKGIVSSGIVAVLLSDPVSCWDSCVFYCFSYFCLTGLCKSVRYWYMLTIIGAMRWHKHIWQLRAARVDMGVSAVCNTCVVFACCPSSEWDTPEIIPQTLWSQWTA